MRIRRDRLHSADRNKEALEQVDAPSTIIRSLNSRASDTARPQIKLVRAPVLILSLAVRRKGIARCTALHLDCARSAWSGSLSVRVGEAVNVSLIIVHALSCERNSPKFLRDIRFDSFEFFLRHWPSFPFFNEMRAGCFAQIERARSRDWVSANFHRLETLVG